MTKDYVLGVTREEYERLGLQHALWKSRAIHLWERAGMPRQSEKRLKVLDCGCGPGFTTFELAKYLGRNSRVVGIDLSEKYLTLLKNRASVEKPGEGNSKLAKIETRNAPIDAFDLKDYDFNAAYARWIFIFLKDPEAAIKNIARHLRPGGVFMLQEYIDYRTMALHPGPKVFRKMVEAIIESWADAGGDANVGARLPKLLEDNGFEVVGLKPQTRIGRPHMKVWQWPDSFFRNYLPILERDGYLTPDEAAECLEAWEEASASDEAFYVGPMVMDIIAQKK